MNELMPPPPTADAVSFARTPESPPTGRVNSLQFRVRVGRPPETPALMLHGAFNVAVDVAGRYSGRMPMPVRVVAVARESGRVHLRTLTREDDLPPSYRAATAAPSVTRSGPPSNTPITEFGYFSIDLKRHLRLPDAGGTYDVFLWLEDILSETAAVVKPPEPGDSPGAAEFGKAARLAQTRAAPGGDTLGPRLAWETGLTGGRRLVGRGGPAPVSVIALALRSGQVAWVSLPAIDGRAIDFTIILDRLLPGAGRHERVLALALSGGQRTSLLDSAKD